MEASVRIAFTDEQESLRQELRAYFAALSAEYKLDESFDTESGDASSGGTYKSITRRLGQDGWLGIGWPKEYGGQDRSMVDQLIFSDEAMLAGIPLPTLTLSTVGPMIMEYGTEDQKQFFLPRILQGEMHFSIGYSEPEGGTDLANLRTRATRDGEEYVINGQKMWTSLIQYADYVWLAVRTDPEAKRHWGLSIILVPTTATGFKWTPVRTMGGSYTSQTFYDDVRVPVANRVAGENEGWKLITGQLNRERVALCSPAGVQRHLGEVRQWAAETTDASGRRVIDREWVRVNLARVHAKTEFLKLINWKVASDVGRGVTPAEASATKVFGTEFYCEAYRLLMECLGEEAYVQSGSPGAKLRGRLERVYRSSLILTFGGGTNEIQRDLIAATALHMPRSPR
jgi:alkylation response protein AidB-like acyl-CoA dehydrogenase